jgi:hypothetical protein
MMDLQTAIGIVKDEFHRTQDDTLRMEPKKGRKTEFPCALSLILSAAEKWERFEASEWFNGLMLNERRKISLNLDEYTTVSDYILAAYRAREVEK